MTVTPEILTSISAGYTPAPAYHGSYVFKWRATDGIYEVYSLWDTSGSGSWVDQDAGNPTSNWNWSIKVDTTNNQWSDNSSNDQPGQLNINGTTGYIECMGTPNTSLLLYVFDPPPLSNWSSGSSGGGSGAQPSQPSQPSQSTRRSRSNFW